MLGPSLRMWKKLEYPPGLVTLHVMRPFRTNRGLSRDGVYCSVFCAGYLVRDRFFVCMSFIRLYLSHNMRFPTMWFVRPAKAQTSLRIRAFASCLNIT